MHGGQGKKISASNSSLNSKKGIKISKKTPVAKQPMSHAEVLQEGDGDGVSHSIQEAIALLRSGETSREEMQPSEERLTPLAQNERAMCLSPGQVSDFPTLWKTEVRRHDITLGQDYETLTGDLKESDVLLNEKGGLVVLEQLSAMIQERFDQDDIEQVISRVRMAAGVLAKCDGRISGLNVTAALSLVEMLVDEGDAEKTSMLLSGDSLDSGYGAVRLIALVAGRIPALGGLQNMEAVNNVLKHLDKAGKAKLEKEKEEGSENESSAASQHGADTAMPREVDLDRCVVGGINIGEAKRSFQALKTGNMSAEEVNTFSEVMGTDSAAARTVKEAFTARVERQLDMSFGQTTVKAVQAMAARMRGLEPIIIAGARDMVGNSKEMPGMAEVLAMRRLAVAVRTEYNLSDNVTAHIEKCIHEATVLQISEADIVCIVAALIADVIKADRDAASGERPRQASDALQTEQKMQNMITRAAAGIWPNNLQGIREHWLEKIREKESNKEACKGIRSTGSSAGKEAWGHCVPFQHGKCTGTRCPRNKKHVIVPCKRPYTPGSKCSYGDGCFFGHP